MDILTSFYSIAELAEMVREKRLHINKQYQRNTGFWPIGVQSYFIDTILNQFPFPKLYFYEYVEMPTGKVRRELVDGQQRLMTIIAFIEGRTRLNKSSENFSGVKFEDLSPQDRERFYSYSVAVDVIRGSTRADILELFRRMNSYTVPLNSAERRHADFDGEFKWFINGAQEEFSDFFVEYGVFSNRQIIRMADGELLTDIVLGTEVGIISTSPANLRDIYKRHDRDFADSDRMRGAIQDVLGYIMGGLSDIRGTMMCRPYCIYSLVLSLFHLKYRIVQFEGQFSIQSVGRFPADTGRATERLLELAAAHEVKSEDETFKAYVWSCAAGVNREPRRRVRTTYILRALSGLDAEPIAIPA